MVALSRSTLERAGVLAAFAAAIAVRVPSLDLPLIEWHGWRQTWTAYTALIYHERGIDLLHPQLPIFGPPFEVPMEFPILQALAALVMDAGVAPDVAVRVTCLVTFLVAAALVWGLARRVAGGVAAFAALLFFLFIPENLLWSRSGMIEYIPIAGAAGFLWAGIAWREDRRWILYAAALAAGSVGMLAKPTTPIFWTLPLVLWRMPAEGQGLGDWVRARLDPFLIALCVVPTMVALAWTAHADAIKASQEAAAFMTSTATRPFYYASLDERLDPVIWKRTWSWLSGYVFGVWLVPVIVLGVIIAVRSRRPMFWIGICLAAVLPFAIFYGGYYKHDYYWTAITPEVAMIFGAGVAWLISRARTLPLRAIAVAALVIAFGLSLASARDYWSRMYPPLSDFEQVLPRARELAALSRPDDLVTVIGRAYDPDLAYYARRRTLMLAEENETGHLVSRLPREGYRVVSSWDPTIDRISVLRAWPWSGSIGPRTYAVGDGASDLRGAQVMATDDPARIGLLTAGRAPILARSLRVPCDGASHPVPAGKSGTWLQLQADGAARVSVSVLLAPLPGRTLIAFTPEAVFGVSSAALMCSGTREIVIEAVYDAPLMP